jgi:hypothetical protein
MSSGLTYAFIADTQEGLNPDGSVSFIFSEYQEAYDYGSWLVNIYPNGRLLVLLWTSGPNQNGFWERIGGEAIFTEVA